MEFGGVRPPIQRIQGMIGYRHVPINPSNYQRKLLMPMTLRATRGTTAGRYGIAFTVPCIHPCSPMHGDYYFRQFTATSLTHQLPPSQRYHIPRTCSVLSHYPTMPSTLSDTYPAKVHAAKTAAHLSSLNPAYSEGTIYLESQHTRLLEDNDEPEPFR